MFIHVYTLADCSDSLRLLLIKYLFRMKETVYNFKQNVRLETGLSLFRIFQSILGFSVIRYYKGSFRGS